MKQRIAFRPCVYQVPIVDVGTVHVLEPKFQYQGLEVISSLRRLGSIEPNVSTNSIDALFLVDIATNVCA